MANVNQWLSRATGSSNSRQPTQPTGYELYNPFLGNSSGYTGSTFINPQSIGGAYTPNYNISNLPTSGGMTNNGGGNQLGRMATLGGSSLFDGGGNTFTSLLTGGLFGGGGGNEFQRYVNDQGQYVWTNPNSRNPVPLANVPGASMVPGKEYRTTANNIQAISDLLPYYQGAVNSQILPTAVANYNATAATSPAYAELMTNMYNTYGSQLNDIGNSINQRNALSQANTDLAVMRGPGQALSREALATAQMYDPEFFSQRTANQKSIQDLINSIDLSGGLSETERREIEQGLSREGVQRGTYGAPNQTQTVANAMRYGNAGYNRQQQAKSNLSAAIQSANQFLPASRTGMDPFQIMTGRPSVANPGNSQFTGLQKTDSSQTAGLASGMFGGFNDLFKFNQQLEANKPTTMDRIQQGVQIGGSLIGSVAGAAAACWVAREVYGKENPKWLLFRNWLLNKSPKWFKNLYLKYGERFAKFISDKPKMKSIIRTWMDTRICNNY